MIQLRDYQRTAIEELRQALKPAASSAVLVLPTGAGKTTVAAELTRLMVKAGKRVWFVAHLIELVSQARARMEAFGLTVGEIAADAHYCPGRPVQCCMVQTLSRRIHRIPAHELPDFIFFDEGHHTAAGTYQKVMAACPNARRIGLTATPERLDGLGLNEYYQHLVAPVSAAQLVALGHLVPAHYALAEVDLEGLAKLKTRGGDYAADEAFERFNKRTLYAGTVTQYRNFAAGQKAIVFCINVEHSRETVAEFDRAGISAAHLDGTTSPATRARTLADFAAGRVQVLSNVALFTEGFDLPDIGCVILNRPTKSRALYLQMVGRGLRPSPGKAACVVVDMGGNVMTHGPFDMEVEHSLEPRAKKSGAATVGVKPMRQCSYCALFSPLQASACVVCGTEFPVVQVERPEADFTLVSSAQLQERAGLAFLPAARKAQSGTYKVLPDDLKGKHEREWSRADWHRVGLLSGYKPGWLNHRTLYQSMHGQPVRAGEGLAA